METIIIFTASDGSNGPYPVLFLFLLLFLVLSFLCCLCVNFLKRSAEPKWNWRLAFFKRNKVTVETLIVNTPSYASTDTYPILLIFLLPLFSFLWWFCVDCLKIIVIQKLNWRLAESGWKTIMVEALIVNTPSGDRTALNLFCLCCYSSLFCDVAADIVWIKTVPLNF